MNILMVLYQKFPPDIRVEKEVRSLLREGHNIFLLAERFGNEQDYEVVDGIQVIRIKKDTNNSNKLIALSKIILRKYTFFNKYLYKTITSIIEKHKIDVIHVHDLPYVGTSLKASKEYNIPIVVDLHENYPAAMREYNSKNSVKKIMKRYTLDSYRRWKQYEERVLKKVDRILVVVPEAIERLRTYRIDEHKVSVISNTEDVDYFKGMEIQQDIVDRYREYFVISYIGGVDSHRGIDCVIKAMPGIIRKVPQVKLLVVGNIDGYGQEMVELANKLGVSEYVEFTGWQPFNKVSTYTYVSDVCLVPHNFSEHTDTTIPHKIFQYMIMKKPIIVSHCRPLKRIVEDANCGLVFKAGDTQDLENCVVRIYNHAELRTMYGENGEKAILEKYNWEITGTELCEIYSNLKSKLG